MTSIIGESTRCSTKPLDKLCYTDNRNGSINNFVFQLKPNGMYNNLILLLLRNIIRRFILKVFIMYLIFCVFFNSYLSKNIVIIMYCVINVKLNILHICVSTKFFFNLQNHIGNKN